jgi:hypothetical protein
VGLVSCGRTFWFFETVTFTLLQGFPGNGIPRFARDYRFGNSSAVAVGK